MADLDVLVTFRQVPLQSVIVEVLGNAMSTCK